MLLPITKTLINMAGLLKRSATTIHLIMARRLTTTGDGVTTMDGSSLPCLRQARVLDAVLRRTTSLITWLLSFVTTWNPTEVGLLPWIESPWVTTRAVWVTMTHVASMSRPIITTTPTTTPTGTTTRSLPIITKVLLHWRRLI